MEVYIIDNDVLLVSLQGSSKMAVDPTEMPIWVGGCEKWVTGLTRRTTCDDVIYALLSHEKNSHEDPDSLQYAVFERWRDVERPLQGRTKILKVWRAWGPEQNSVKFSMRKVNGLMVSQEILRSKRHKKHHSQTHKSREHSSSKSKREKSRSQSHHEQKRRSSSTENHERRHGDNHERRHGENHERRHVDIHERKQRGNDSEKEKQGKLNQIVQLVLNQQRMLQEQVSRTGEMERKIEEYETSLHNNRIRENGQNYVQEAYLKELSEDSLDELFPNLSTADMDAYLDICGNILQLEDTISREKGKIDDLNQTLHEESTLCAPPDYFTQPKISTCAETRDSHIFHEKDNINEIPFQQGCNSSTNSHQGASLEFDIAALRDELDRCCSFGKSQEREIERVAEELSDCELDIELRKGHINTLLLELESMDKTDDIPPELQYTEYGHPDSGCSGGDTSPISSRPITTYHTSHDVSNKQNNSVVTITSRYGGVTTVSQPGCSRTSQYDVTSALGDHISQQTPYTDDYAYKNYDNDSNSDTGLSSLHSDESTPILETLV